MIIKPSNTRSACLPQLTCEVGVGAIHEVAMLVAETISHEHIVNRASVSIGVNIARQRTQFVKQCPAVLFFQQSDEFLACFEERAKCH